MIDAALVAEVFSRSSPVRPVLLCEAVGGTPYNVIRVGRKFYATHQANGAFDVAKVITGAYEYPVHTGDTLAAVTALATGQPVDRSEEITELLAYQVRLETVVTQSCKCVPPGHYYSPIPSEEDVEANLANRVWPPPKDIGPIDLREEKQLERLHLLAAQYRSHVPFHKLQTAGHRYKYVNPEFLYYDAFTARHFLLEFRPRRIIEIGAGHSSSLMLDVADADQLGTRFTFIDPNPERLLSILTEKDKTVHKIIARKIQEVDLEIFDELEEGDILFIDSTHVSKLDSDVNYYMFFILPRLKPGVVVHIHDIDFPFEYTPVFLEEGRAWNEAYLLRAFLSYNRAFQIEFWVAFTMHHHGAFVHSNMPLCGAGQGGSFWMRKILPG